VQAWIRRTSIAATAAADCSLLTAQCPVMRDGVHSNVHYQHHHHVSGSDAATEYRADSHVSHTCRINPPSAIPLVMQACCR